MRPLAFGLKRRSADCTFHGELRLSVHCAHGTEGRTALGYLLSTATSLRPDLLPWRPRAFQAAAASAWHSQLESLRAYRHHCQFSAVN